MEIDDPWCTEDLIIRDFRVCDLDELARVLCDGEVGRYSSAGAETREEVAEFIHEARAQHTRTPRTKFLRAITRKSDGLVIGQASLFRKGADLSIGEIGWVIGRVYWNSGYATQVAKKLLSLAHDTFGQHRVFATTHPDNKASIRVLEKAGMEREGRLRLNAYRHGRWSDSLVYSSIRAPSQ